MRCLIYVLTLTALTAGSVVAQAAKEPFSWRPVSPEQVEGKGWTATAAPFDRFPAAAEKRVRPAVWKLSRDSAGICVDFTTDATTIAVRWTLASRQLAKPHMAATGVSGLDLYVRMGDQWQFGGTARPTQIPTNQTTIATGLAADSKQCRIYLPLYNGVASLEIGTPANATFKFSGGRREKPIVFYGTSITHGGCASRPGMSYPAILGRRLDMPVVNLGFSGNGKCEPEVAELLGELDPALFVIDPLPNNMPAQAAKLLPRFLDVLRDARPETPILLISSPHYADGPVVAAKARRGTDADRVVAKIHRERLEAGDKNLYFTLGADFTGNGGDATVDGTHPTDLGFMQMADAFEPPIRRALQTP